MQGLLGKKIGMTQVVTEDGKLIPVTVIEAGPCVVVQCKTKETDGYEAVQLGYQEIKGRNLSKAVKARFEKIKVSPQRYVKEFRVEKAEDYKPGDKVTVSMFEGVGFVDVIGTSKGRGFQGVVKRYKMAGGPHSHGGHSKRRPGSIGQCSYPGRVAKGQKMPGHMGNVRVSTQNLKVVSVDSEENMILVHGAVPGPNGGVITISKALKKKAGKA